MTRAECFFAAAVTGLLARVKPNGEPEFFDAHDPRLIDAAARIAAAMLERLTPDEAMR